MGTVSAGWEGGERAFLHQPLQTHCSANLWGCLHTTTLTWEEHHPRKRYEKGGNVPARMSRSRELIPKGHVGTSVGQAMQLQLSVADRCCDKLWGPAMTVPSGLPGACSAFPEQDGGCVVATAPNRDRQHGASSSHKASAHVEWGKARVSLRNAVRTHSETPLSAFTPAPHSQLQVPYDLHQGKL